jgi:hypothetical protein
VTEAEYRIVECAKGYYRVEQKRKFLWLKWWEPTYYSSSSIEVLKKCIEKEKFVPKVVEYL